MAHFFVDIHTKRAEEKERVKHDYKETERRLFRYPELKKNIEEYRADIEDIKREDLEKSKDIVKFSINGGNTPQEDIEEKRQKLIANLESRIASDLYEIRQIDRALERVKGDEHFPIIEAYYFEKCDTEKLEGQFHYSERTIRRYRKNLVNMSFTGQKNSKKILSVYCVKKLSFFGVRFCAILCPWRIAPENRRYTERKQSIAYRRCFFFCRKGGGAAWHGYSATTENASTT